MKKTKQLELITHAVGYVRGSDKEQENTAEAQENTIRPYCEYKKITLAQVFVEAGKDAQSATKTNFLDRPKVIEMLEYMEAHDIRGIVVAKLDRAWRNPIDTLRTIEALSARGIQIHILDINLDPTTPVGEMVVTILSAMARFECRRKSERQREAADVMRANGRRCGSVPYGWDAVTALDRTSKTGRQAENLVSNEAEQKVLRWMKTEKESGAAISAIARQLNQWGIPTKKNGKKWFPASVESVLEHARFDQPNQQEENAA